MQGRHREYLKTTATATTLTQESEKVKQGETWYAQRVSVRNSTTNNADCLVSIVVAGLKHPVYFFKNLTPEEWGVYATELLLYYGEYLSFDWSTIVSTEVCEVVILGNRRF